MMLAALGAGLLELLLGHVLARNRLLLANLRGKVLPEFLEHRHPLLLAVGDVVELVLELRGVLVVHPVREMLREELVHDTADVGWREALLVENHVLPVHERGDDRGIRRGTSDAVLLERLHQARFRIARRWLREVLLAVELVDLHRVALLERRQALFLFLDGVVLVLVVHGIEAGEHHRLAGRPEQVVFPAHGEIDGYRVEPGGRHLGSDRPLPDHFVELALLVVQERRDGFRRARNRRWPDRLVGLLRVLGGAAVFDRRFRQVVGTVVLGDVATHLGDSVLRQRDRIRSHVSDETGDDPPHAHAFIETLRDFHRAVGRESELAHRLLLQGRSGEGRRRRAQFALLLDLVDARFAAAMGLEEPADLLLPRGIADGELVELFCVEMGELRGEGDAALLAVEVDRPVFLALEALDLELALDDEPQGRALHAAG